MDDIITEIKQVKNHVYVAVGGGETLLFPRAAFDERALACGDSVDLEELKQWLLVRQYQEALDKAISFLTVRARSSLEVQRKLEDRGYLERTVELVLYKLTKEGLLDDEAFARDWAQARARRQLGKGRISLELRQKGIPADMAKRAIEGLSLEGEAEGSLRKLAHKLLKRVKDEPDAGKAMRKVMAALSRRGFSYEEASRAAQAALADMGEE